MEWFFYGCLFGVGIMGFILGVMNFIRLNKIEEELKKYK